MTGLRRRSLALTLAAATAFGGAVAAPAVAETTSSTADSSLPSSSTGDLPTSSADVEGSVQGSLDDNCGGISSDSIVFGEIIKCGVAVVGGATVLFSVLALLRSVFYEITRF
ncbi:hypothetical protein [Corynebacterium sp.]|jgi:hypothetical protein|uniref:hypothetical protein n=1 Tax=Corynebacterium sp. TaxID=1720 RepID=UPI0025BA81A4|nr:hypothetical protein [Corynebacterium sp.]